MPDTERTIHVPSLTTHHDGHGLNESLTITHDDRDPDGGGASHRYIIGYTGPPDAAGYALGTQVAYIQFQHGPRHAACSVPGVTEAALYAILIDRLEAFQAGAFACDANAAQLVHLRAALALTKARADERAARGVLGHNLA